MLRQLLLKSSATASTRVALTGKTIARSSNTGQISVYIQLSSDGTCHKSSLSGTDQVVSGEWMLTGTAADYDVRATVTSGTNPSSGSGVGTWLNLATTRSWTNTSSAVIDSGPVTSVITLEIRDKVTLAVLVSASITLQADYSSI